MIFKDMILKSSKFEFHKLHFFITFENYVTTITISVDKKKKYQAKFSPHPEITLNREYTFSR